MNKLKQVWKYWRNGCLCLQKLDLVGLSTRTMPSFCKSTCMSHHKEALILNCRKDIHDSKAVVNIKNEDLECFKWSIPAALHPASKDAQCVTKYQEYKDELNFEGINFSCRVYTWDFYRGKRVHLPR